MKAPDQDSQFVTLNWVGPFSYGESGLKPDPKEHRGKPGIYAVIGDHHTHGSRSLLYIGTTNKFERRIEDEHRWLKDEWGLEIYLARLDKHDKQSREEIERFLIYAHSPPYCSKAIDSITVRSHLRIWNVGRYWRLLPELSTRHPWYPDVGIQAVRREMEGKRGR